jgi:hypothetical protein
VTAPAKVTVTVHTRWGQSTVERVADPLSLRDVEPLMVEAFEGSLQSLGFPVEVVDVRSIRATAVRALADVFAQQDDLGPLTPANVADVLKRTADEIERGERS